MAEAIALVALAGNVLQFLESGGKFASKAIEICRHRADSHDGPSNLKRLRHIASDFQDLLEKIQRSATRTAAGSSRNSQPQDLASISSDCSSIIQEVLKKLSKIDVNNNFKRTNLILTEFKATWHRRDIEELEMRMAGLREQLATHIIVALRDLAFQSLAQQDAILAEIKALRNETALTKKLRSALGDSAPTAAPGEVLMQSVFSYVEEEDDVDEDLRESSVLMMAMQRKLASLHEIGRRLEPDLGASNGGSEIQMPTSRKIQIQQDFILSLNYKEREYRESAISSPYDKTCRWIFSEDAACKNGGFTKWLRSSSDLFWVTGKPGSGKSTLMKYISDFKSGGQGAKTCRQHLMQWAGSSELHTPCFFFWSSGSAIEGSQNAMLRSLLVQLLEKKPEIIPRIVPTMWESAYLFNTPIRNTRTNEELAQILFDAAGMLLGGGAKLCFFIDGLDEFDSSPSTLISVIRRISELPNVKLCVSSRPWVEFGDAFGKKASLRVQDLTYPDIKHFVESQFDENSGFKRLKTREPEYSELLTRQIVEKADGVFLWVRIVVRSLLAGLTNDDRIRDLENRLRALPPELDQLYDKILKDVGSDAFYFQHACQYFELMLKVGGSTPAILLSFADEEREDYAVRLPSKPLRRRKRADRMETIRRRLNSRCKGLLEVGDNERVNFLHRTVKDYLQRPEIRSKMDGALAETTFDPHLQLCSAYLAMIKTSGSVSPKGPLTPSDSLLDLFESCLKFASRITRGKDQLLRIMHCLHRIRRLHSDKFASSLYDKRVCQTPLRVSVGVLKLYTFSGDEFLNVATRAGVFEYLKSRVRSGALSDVKCTVNRERANAPARLMLAAWRNATALAGKLPNGREAITDRSPLPLLLDACLCSPPNVDVFRLLLERGAKYHSVLRIPNLWLVYGPEPVTAPRTLRFKTRGASLLAVVVGAALLAVVSEEGSTAQRDLWEKWARVLRLFVTHGAKLDESLAGRVAERLMGWQQTKQQERQPQLVNMEALFNKADVYEVLRTVSTRDYGVVGQLLSRGADVSDAGNRSGISSSYWSDTWTADSPDGSVGTRILHSLLFSPLPSHIPGPLLARLTPLYALSIDLSGTRAHTLSTLHQKYGPIVRLSPTEVSFSSRAAINAIYGPGTVVIKAEAYKNMGRTGLFQMRDKGDHRERLRRVGHVFRKESLGMVEGVVQGVMGRLVEVLAGEEGKGALEVAGEVLMGKGFGALEEGGDSEKLRTYVEHLDNVFVVWTMEDMMPTVMWCLDHLVPLRAVKEFMIAGEYLYGYGRDAVNEYIEREGRGKSSRRTLLTKLVTGNEETGAEPLSDEEIVTEVSNMTFAAVDTTGTTATYALYELACYPEWQRRLQLEIRESGVAESGFEYRVVRDLPVLNAVVMEALRLYPAAPGGLPRVIIGPVTVIDGLALPAGVLVSMQARTTQRDPAYFPNPDTFDPARWLVSDHDGKDQIFAGTPEMQEMMLVWGGKGGPRACVGQYMATMELKLLLARLMDRFMVTLESEATHDEMVMTDHFVLIPKGRRCGLVFNSN
ncbi:hypothetical protein OQA88_12736 [Cercophora sp. LCS_1]